MLKFVVGVSVPVAAAQGQALAEALTDAEVAAQAALVRPMTG